ncbi:hypothetical protein BTO30_14195 [Domibacillus antri]|uniref:Uncharacterized protein n=1 Tax=Domibacillus antri TaxID=1714264 RepID=A0A1Q8Q2R4_9BACI|nr:hypothetical protein [Domibacillus antri]OLN21626.1 hypothetical protein BTO30_14195 [Domibacillus antri]
MDNQDSIILQSNSIRQVTYQGSGMYMFQPGRKPITKKEQQAKDAAFKKRLDEARIRLAAEENTSGGDAA